MSSYTLNFVVLEVLGRVFPSFTQIQLTKWLKSYKTYFRVIQHLNKCTEANLMLLDKLDIMRRTSEYARLYGIDFYSVLSRGSQFRVEAVMLRIAHHFDYIAATATKAQLKLQAKMEVIPLVMEPEAGYYKEPVLVLDFQSLYPSMMIAYNLCFSTCIGALHPGMV